MKRDNSRHLKSYKKIGANIKTIRLSKKMSQEELAFRISSTRNYIGCIERGEKFPSIAILLDIAQVFECKLNNLTNNV